MEAAAERRPGSHLVSSDGFFKRRSSLAGFRRPGSHGDILGVLVYFFSVPRLRGCTSSTDVGEAMGKPDEERAKLPFAPC